MPRILFLIAATLQFSGATAQRSFYDFVDSTIGSTHFSDKDWAMGFSIEQAGVVPFYDSLGNVRIEPEQNSTIVIFSIRNIFYLQRFRELCYDSDTCFHASSSIRLPGSIKMNYTVDSIGKAEKEWIYPFIYRDDSTGVYIYQEDGNHSPHYSLQFITRQLNTSKHFWGISNVERAKFMDPWVKNLNFPHNSATFTYRAFLEVKQFLEDNKKMIPLD